MHRRLIDSLASLVVLLALATTGCRPGPATDWQPLTESERAAIADTLGRLSMEASQTFDSDLDCSEIAERLPFPDGAFVSQGRLTRLNSKDELEEMCRAIKQDRISAHEEIEEQMVDVLTRDAAYLVTRSVYTVDFRDGRTRSRPLIVTSVWARHPEGWRMVHLHESWPAAGSPSASPPDAARAR